MIEDCVSCAHASMGIEIIARRIERGMATADDAALLRNFWTTLRSKTHEQMDSIFARELDDQCNLCNGVSDQRS